MHQLTREEDHLILFRHDHAARAQPNPVVPGKSAVIQAQLTALKGLWLRVEEIDERQCAAGNLRVSVVAVVAEKIPVIAGGDLHFSAPWVKRLHPELPENQGQHAAQPLKQPFLMLGQSHEYPERRYSYPPYRHPVTPGDTTSLTRSPAHGRAYTAAIPGVPKEPGTLPPSHNGAKLCGSSALSPSCRFGPRSHLSRRPWPGRSAMWPRWRLRRRRHFHRLRRSRPRRFWRMWTSWRCNRLLPGAFAGTGALLGAACPGPGGLGGCGPVRGSTCPGPGGFGGCGPVSGST